MSPLTPVNREDLDRALDRVMDKLEGLSKEVQDSALVGVANQIRIDALTLQLGKIHTKTGDLALDMAAMQTIAKAEGRVVRVRDVVWTVSIITTAILVMRFLKVIP